jgi:hypothetical protein
MTPLAALRASVKAAFAAAGVNLEAPTSAVMRLIRAVGPRVSLQQIALQDQAPDANPVEVWPGVPGVTSDPSDGEEVVILFVGKDQVPYVIGRGREGGPGDVPQAVRHDAVTAIRFLSRAASLGAKVRVGADLPTPPVPVAIAPKVAEAFAQVETAFVAVAAYASAVAAVDSSFQPAATALTSALSSALSALAALSAAYPTGYTSTNLEAK